MVDGMLTTHEAAELLGIHPSRVRHMIREGRIKAEQRRRIGRGGVEWLIPEAELEQARQRRPYNKRER